MNMSNRSSLREIRYGGFLNATHVDMSCVLFRKEVVEAITFVDAQNAKRVGRERLSGGCECANACHDIRQMGLRIGFLPNVYAEHLHHSAVIP